MKISARGRYALSAMIDIAMHSAEGECIAVVNISERLGISKIYLEQVFSLLKKGGLVTSVKGAQGGYRLARPPHAVTAYDILLPVETSLFEEPDAPDPASKGVDVEKALIRKICNPLSEAVRKTLQSVTLEDLRNEARFRGTGAMMYYI